MTASHTVVQERHFFWCNIFINVCNISILRLYKKLKFVCKITLWMAFDPIASQRVIHHVTNNPVCCKQLCCCWNVFFFDSSFIDIDYLIMLFSNIVLVHPSDDLYLIFPVLFFNIMNKLIYKPILLYKSQAKEEF